MPKLYEKERKINMLKQGKNVRPPKTWWDKMHPTIQRQYPGYSKNEVDQVLGGIWNSYSEETKIKIIKEYQTNSPRKNKGPDSNILGKRY